MRVFQGDADRDLETRIWFDAFVIRDATRREVSIEEFMEGGKRWWDAFYANDPRTGGHGLFPLAKQPRSKPWWKFW